MPLNNFIQARVKCPYCGREKGLALELKDAKEPRIESCPGPDWDAPGCDRFYVVVLKISVEAHTYEIDLNNGTKVL